MNRRTFLKTASAAGGTLGAANALAKPEAAAPPKGAYHPGRIVNEFDLLLPGEKESLAQSPQVSQFGGGGVHVHLGSEARVLRPGESLGGWRLVTITNIDGSATAIFEKHVTHQGAILYATEAGGVIARIPKGIGELARIRPRPVNTSHGVKLERTAHWTPGPDVTGEYILNSAEDPCYENVAALGLEYIGWTLVANEQAGPLKSLFLEADGRSRQLNDRPEGEGLWAPDVVGAVFDPSRFLPDGNPQLYRYMPGYSKRTLLGGYLPVADIGVWNPEYKCGYEVMVLLPPGTDAKAMGRVRFLAPEAMASHPPRDASMYREGNALYIDRYWNCTAESFFPALAGIWNYWHDLIEDRMPVEIPDHWLLNAARAGITLSRCSYRGLEPTYQIGEGAYTKIPERSHSLFPVAHYEFIWAQQLWNLAGEAEPYFQHYLDHYILPDGNFVYNTQDQVEAPLNAGIFLTNSARAYAYTGDVDALDKRLPVLQRMLDFVLRRYEYSKRTFARADRRHGLIWGSPEADLGDPRNDFPESHPYYYQNAVWTWRGLVEHSRCLARAAQEHGRAGFEAESKRMALLATEMRGHIERSLRGTIAAEDAGMRAAGITPFTPDDIRRDPTHLESYENHRFMMDWFTADWGDAALDLGHLKHRELAGQQIIGLHTDGAIPRTSNFMAHGTLAVRVRQDDYRPFLLTLYALVCYAADSGNRYSPEDAYLPGSYPGEASPYGWSAVVNSVLQPALGLRWLLCYEESALDVCHLQKAAPKHWFAKGERIRVEKCPTRFGKLTWTTETLDHRRWAVTVEFTGDFTGDLIVHIHPPDGAPLKTATHGKVDSTRVIFTRAELAGKKQLRSEVS